MRGFTLKAVVTAGFFCLAGAAHAKMEWLGHADNWWIGWESEDDGPYCALNWIAGGRVVSFMVGANHKMLLAFQKDSWKIPANTESTVTTRLLPDPLQVRQRNDKALVVHDAFPGVVEGLLNALSVTPVAFQFKGNEGEWTVSKMDNFALNSASRECESRLEALPAGASDAQPF
ncbi:hypothetical protein [Rhizobium rhizogenes]|uniref:hypothetical protein n=1 Tax=Rhizobium rhizogenes TaxID=359 RepID=UPI001572B5E6|nr:hypothetical protein [Rhizobium rhizogenes]NTF65755.1 hypothetical protein [Rhizobium rhizogenes]NTG97107.1 hypothetical protein [Rhizobium rhizogenes]